MRKTFDEQLMQLNREMITMGSLCEKVIAMAAKSLLEGDKELAAKVVHSDSEIDQKEREIEAMCLKLLLQQQPVARDLRIVSSALKMITDMERIGDQSADIAEIVTVADLTASDDTMHIGNMARAAIKMVTGAVDAFVSRDVRAAVEVIKYDDVVDDLFNKVKHELLESLHTSTEKAEYALDLLMIAKYFERIGDHATNIAEWVVFSITGRHDAGIRNMVVYTLRSTGFEAEGLPDGAAFFDAIKKTRPQLVLLDIMLPGDDGLTILKKLRDNPATAEIPVILATAKGSEYDKVTGLDLGADDYLAKPFGMMEMVSRVKAVLRRTTPRQDQQVLQAGALSLNLGEHLVTVDGQRVTLTLKEFEVLRVMMEHVGQVFTRERLLGEIWGYDFNGETRTVDVHMRTLRQKLGRCGDYIETVRGVGYRLEVEHP